MWKLYALFWWIFVRSVSIDIICELKKTNSYFSPDTCTSFLDVVLIKEVKCQTFLSH